MNSNQKLSTRPNSNYKRVQEMNTEPSKTQQNHKDECDVNKIIEKAKKGLPVTHVQRKNGSFVDTTQIPDYHTALQTIADANSAFMQLNAKTRSRFQNDPSELLSFLADPKNKQEAISLGLVEAPKPVPTNQATPQNQTNTQQQSTQTNQTQTQQSTQTQPTQNTTPT